MLPEAHPGNILLLSGGGEVWFSFYPTKQSRRRHPVLPVPARPRRPAVRRPVPTRPGYVRVLDSTGLHRISLVRASGETRRRVFDALVGAREACFLGEQFCWHPVLPDPAPPPRRALRSDAPLICLDFGFDR